MWCFGGFQIISVIVRHDGGDVGGCGGRVLHSTDYGSGGDGFCKGGYLSVVEVLWLSVVCVMAVVVLIVLK